MAQMAKDPEATGEMRSQLNRLRLTACVTLFIGALVYLILKSILAHDSESDFRFLWTAGRM